MTTTTQDSRYQPAPRFSIGAALARARDLTITTLCLTLTLALVAVLLGGPTTAERDHRAVPVQAQERVVFI
jgi:hypothetical protein